MIRSQYRQTFDAQLTKLTGAARLDFLFACACEAQSDEANRLGVETLVMSERVTVLDYLRARLSAGVVDEWVYQRALDLCRKLDAPFRPVLQTEITC